VIRSPFRLRTGLGQPCDHARAAAPSGEWTEYGTALAILLAALFLPVSPVHAQGAAQPAGEARREGAFPDASFEMAFQKYTPPAKNVYSPYYSWDADMSVDLTVFRKGSSALDFEAVFQTAGTENLGAKVSVGGTAYILRFGYDHAYSDDIELSAGVSHLSSHLTRDLDEKTDEQRAKNAAIPDVEDPGEYNVLYLRGQLFLRRWAFTPVLEAIVQPLNFCFNGRSAPDVRPIYLGSRWTFWQGHGKSIRLTTRHEFGTNPFNHFSLSLELFERNGSEGRVAVFVSGSPGDGMHVSPNIGALRDGIAMGLRIRFQG